MMPGPIKPPTLRPTALPGGGVAPGKSLAMQRTPQVGDAGTSKTTASKAAASKTAASKIATSKTTTSNTTTAARRPSGADSAQTSAPAKAYTVGPYRFTCLGNGAFQLLFRGAGRTSELTLHPGEFPDIRSDITYHLDLVVGLLSALGLAALPEGHRQLVFWYLHAAFNLFRPRELRVAAAALASMPGITPETIAAVVAALERFRPEAAKHMRYFLDALRKHAPLKAS
jgi:hypothetical protein